MCNLDEFEIFSGPNTNISDIFNLTHLQNIHVL